MISPYQICSGTLRYIGPGKDWGVVADRAIHAGDTVEIAPILKVIDASTQHLMVQRCVFSLGSLGGTPGQDVIVLGYGSMYNHANPANMRYRAIFNGMASAMVFVAAREIQLGEELTINYNDTKGDNVSTWDDWFERHGITPVA
jgi:SET domain-containing protein